ncbi:MAG: hypothetical protein LBR22_08080 [Desulfovibrio sp.]|nr:hypothetical protein [Desulfovibrio sp.]
MYDYLSYIVEEGDVFIENLLSQLAKRPTDLLENLDALCDALTNNVDPPFKDRDLESLIETINASRAGDPPIRRTPIATIILPILRGERTLTEDEEELIDDYSNNLIRSLKNGDRKLVLGEGVVVRQSSVKPVETPTPAAATKAPDQTARPAAPTPETKQAPTPVHVPPEDDVREAPPVPTPSPIITKPMSRVEKSARNLLSERRTCELYWLMKCAAEPFVPLWLAELLYLGTRLQPGFHASQMRIKAIVESDEVYSAVDTLDESGAMLLAASLVRPVLMMPSSTHKFLLDNLHETLDPYRCGQLLDRLGDFATKGVPLDDGVFMDLSMLSQRRQRLEDLQRRTREILETAQYKKTSFQRATVVLKELFSTRGDIGKVLDACLKDDFTLLPEALQQSWDNKDFVSDVVNEMDKRINKPSATFKRIDFKALDAIIREATAAQELMREWEQIRTQGTKQRTDDFSHRQLNEIAEAARPDDIPDSPFNGFLRDRLEELRSRFGKSTASQSPIDPLEELALWPLFLGRATFGPDGFRVDEGEMLDFIGRSAANRTDTSVRNILDDQLIGHMKQGDFTPVESFLRAFPLRKTPEIGESLESQRRKWSDQFNELQETITNAIGDAYLRGVILESRESDLNRDVNDIVRLHLDRLMDVAQATAGLKTVRRRLEEEETGKKEELRKRLDELAPKISPENAAQIGRMLESREYGATHDAITQAYDSLRKGTTLHLTPMRTTSSAAADYYKALRQGPIAESQTVVPGGAVSAWKSFLLSRPQPINLSDGVNVARITELLQWLGFSLEQKAALREVYAEGRPSLWQVLTVDMTVEAPLPQWGSGAGRRHIVVLGRPTSPEYLRNLLNTLFTDKTKGISKNQPITVLWFGSLTHDHRMQLVQQGRRQGYLPVIVDSNLFFWLSRQPDAERTEKFFAVALAGSPSNPYTPNAGGAVPREMFFGRQQDIEALWDPYGPCIVYGGRQLGKSALLLQVKERFDNESQGNRVLLHSMQQSDTSLVETALRLAIAEGIVKRQTTVKTFSDNIKDYLDGDASRRILMLFDECDDIIEHDANNVSPRAKSGFPDLTVFRDLMTQTQRRFKIVLTGLHSVQRYSRIPNSPLPHFGIPLCIGPLQPGAASDLVRCPMETLGLHFNEATLVNKVLAYTNYHPSLVQLFCEELVRTVGTKVETAATLPVAIDKDTIVQVYRKPTLQANIRQRFEWTLDLDLRYTVIGYTLAMWELAEGGAQAGSGIRVMDLLDELRENWPEAFQDAELTTVESLLEEMVGLGMLSPVGSMYRLRTPNIIHLLGGEENILNKLGQFRDRPYTPQGHAEDMRTVLADGRPDPLVVTQYNALQSRQNGLILIVGSKALGLGRVPDTLKHIGMSKAGENDMEIKVERIVGLSGKGDMTVQELASCLGIRNQEHKKGGLLLWLDGESTGDIVGALRETHVWLGRLHTEQKVVKVAYLLDADTYLSLTGRSDVADILNSAATHVLFLHRWNRAGLEGWYNQTNTVPLQPVEETLRNTGGWDGRVMAVLEKRPLPDLAEPGYACPEDPQVAKIIETVTSYGDPLTAEEYWELVQPTTEPRERIFTLLDTLVHLGVLVRGQKGLFLEPCLQRCMDEAGDKYVSTAAGKTGDEAGPGGKSKKAEPKTASGAETPKSAAGTKADDEAKSVAKPAVKEKSGSRKKSAKK